MSIHIQIIATLVESGYPVPSFQGVCVGLGGMARQSILTDEISSFNRFVEIFDPNRSSPPLNKHEIQAWLDGVFLYQYAVDQHRITRIFHQQAFKSIAALNASEKLEAEGGLVQLAEFKESYTLDSLIKSFQALRQAASLQQGYAPLTLDVFCNQHLITVAYDPCKGDWIYSDANHLPIRRIEEVEAFALEVMSSFVLFDNDRQKAHEYVLNHRDSYSLELKILSYSTAFTQENSRDWIVSWIKARKLSTSVYSLVPKEEMEALFVSVYDITIAKKALKALGRAYPRSHRMFMQAVENNNTHAIEAMLDVKLLSERQLEEGLFHALKCHAFESQKRLLKAANYDLLPLQTLLEKAFQYCAPDLLQVILSSPAISVFDINILIYSSYRFDNSFGIKELLSHMPMPFEKKVCFVENLVRDRKFKILGILLEEYGPHIDPHELLNMLYDAISAGENDALEVCLTHGGVNLPAQRMTTLMARAIEANNKKAFNLILGHSEFNPSECFYSSPYGENSDLIVSNVLVLAIIKQQSLLAIALLKHPKTDLGVIESSTTPLLALATKSALPEVVALLQHLNKAKGRPYNPRLFDASSLITSVQPLLQSRLS